MHGNLRCARYALNQIRHLTLLDPQLGRIAHVLIPATTTATKKWTGRQYAVHRGPKYFSQPSPSKSRVVRHTFDFHGLPCTGKRHKDRLPVHAPHPVASERHIVNVHGDGFSGSFFCLRVAHYRCIG